MSDRFWAKIWIGGPVPDSLMPDLRDQLNSEGLLASDNDISDCLDDRGLLVLEDFEATYGWFEELEEWLENNGIEFNRQSDGYADIEPELVAFRKGIGKTSFILDHNDYHTVRVDDLLAQISRNPNLADLVSELKRLAGQDLSPLKPFTADATPQVVAADELKRRNTDPMATECAQCGGTLSDPSMGPAYKHCPRCEP
jgi:hypothetical protein